MHQDPDEDDDAALARALALSREHAQPSPPPPAVSQSETPLLAQLPSKFRVVPAAAVGNASLENTGRIILPQACLNVFSTFFGDNLPSTILIRLVGDQGSSAYVGVAEFVEDAQCAAWVASAANPVARNQPPPRLFPRGPLAACFVPRWVRGALIIDPMVPEANLQLVALPLASHMLLRPHKDDFAKALSEHAGGDVEATLTTLMNRFPVVSKGATLTLQVGSEYFLVDVLALRGLRHVRCGTTAATTATAGGSGGAGGAAAEDDSELVPAACLVDANVNVDFAPSVQSEAAEAVREERAKAALEAKRLAESDEREAAAKAEAAAALERQSEEASILQRQTVAAESLAALEADAVMAADPVRVSCAVKLPDGRRCTFNVPSGAPLTALWWSVDAQGFGGGNADYALVTSYPRRRLLRPTTYPMLTRTTDISDAAADASSTAGPTLRSEGLAEPAQQAFFLEML